MPQFQVHGTPLHYETFGDSHKPAVLFIAGLGGLGASWGPQIERFARDYFAVVPDHRGTGQSGRPAGGYTIAQHASDFAALLQHLGTGPAHVAGTSTGGAIAQTMALDHAPAVRSIAIVSSFARADPWFRRQFAFRRKLVAEADMHTVYSCNALFLFSPEYTSRNEPAVIGWIERAAATPAEREIALKRIDMILAHDEYRRLGQIRHPSLVLCGEQDVCTPPYFSAEIAAAIPGAQYVTMRGGHFIHIEAEEEFFQTVHGFMNRAG